MPASCYACRCFCCCQHCRLSRHCCLFPIRCCCCRRPCCPSCPHLRGGSTCAGPAATAALPLQHCHTARTPPPLAAMAATAQAAPAGPCPPRPPALAGSVAPDPLHGGQQQPTRCAAAIPVPPQAARFLQQAPCSHAAAAVAAARRHQAPAAQRCAPCTAQMHVVCYQPECTPPQALYNRTAARLPVLRPQCRKTWPQSPQRQAHAHNAKAPQCPRPRPHPPVAPKHRAPQGGGALDGGGCRTGGCSWHRPAWAPSQHRPQVHHTPWACRGRGRRARACVRPRC